MLQGPEFLGPQARGRGVIPRGPIEIEESGINDDDGRGRTSTTSSTQSAEEPLNEDGSACDRAAVRPLRSQILPHTTGDERNTYPRPNTSRPVGRRATVPPRRRYVSWAPTTTECLPARQPSEQMTLNREWEQLVQLQTQPAGQRREILPRHHRSLVAAADFRNSLERRTLDDVVARRDVAGWRL